MDPIRERERERELFVFRRQDDSFINIARKFSVMRQDKHLTIRLSSWRIGVNPLTMYTNVITNKVMPARNAI